MRRLITATSLALLVTVAIGVGYAFAHDGGNRLTVVLPNAIGIVEGTPVQLNGFDVGQVANITTRDNHAILALRLNTPSQPLHTGTTVTVEWRSLLGERYLQLHPGPAGNPSLPNGAMIAAGSSQIVVEDLLQALDAATRSHLTSFLHQFDTVMSGHQEDFNQTLQSAGPSLQALGAVTAAVGSDGLAIQTVLANLHSVTGVLATRTDGVANTILDLNKLTSTAEAHQAQLSEGLGKLPATLDAAEAALNKVPVAAAATAPLLDQLRPAADRLPGVAANLSPAMDDLRPTLRLLGPTLNAADRLLGPAPDFLDEAVGTFPPLRQAIEGAGPGLGFLRPYTPEFMGFLSGWGNAFSNYDSVGHFATPLVVEGSTALDNQPAMTLPTQTAESWRLPGQNVGQPWTDASGSGPR